MAGSIRRVVTGHDKNGRAIVVSDGPAPFVHHNPLLPGWQSTDIWRTDATPASIPSTPGETTLGPRRQLPTKNATVLRITDTGAHGSYSDLTVPITAETGAPCAG